MGLALAQELGGTFVGHTWVGTERELPILGVLRTQTDTWVIAELRVEDGRVTIEQRPCGMEIKPVAGVHVGMDQAGLQRLPSTTFHFDSASGGGLEAPAWRQGWGEEDVDHDGDPGATIRVRHPLCGGRLQVASDTTSTATGRWEGGALVGDLSVEVGQRILGASGACLKLAARDSVETMRGGFRYTPVLPGSGCEASTLGR